MKRPREGDLRASGEDRRLRGGQIRTRVRGGSGEAEGPWEGSSGQGSVVGLWFPRNEAWVGCSLCLLIVRWVPGILAAPASYLVQRWEFLQEIFTGKLRGRKQAEA